MSSRRNASVVVALGVASLAAMVATSELLAESFDRPAADRLDPPMPDLGRPGIIQVEPPRQEPVAVTTPAAAPAPATAAEPARPDPNRPRRHGRHRADHKPHADRRSRTPSPPRPDRPRPAGRDDEPSGGSFCPDRHRRDEDNHRRWPGRDRPHPDRDRHERDRDDHRHRWHRDGHRSGAHQR